MQQVWRTGTKARIEAGCRQQTASQAIHGLKLYFRAPRPRQQARTERAATGSKEEQEHRIEGEAEDLDARMSPGRQHPALDL